MVTTSRRRIVNAASLDKTERRVRITTTKRAHAVSNTMRLRSLGARGSLGSCADRFGPAARATVPTRTRFYVMASSTVDVDVNAGIQQWVAANVASDTGCRSHTQGGSDVRSRIIESRTGARAVHSRRIGRGDIGVRTSGGWIAAYFVRAA